MNILFLEQFASIGGGQRSLLDLLPMVRRRGWKARVAVPAEGAFFERARADGFEVDLVPCGTYSAGRKTLADSVLYVRQVPPMAKAIKRLVAEHSIDLLYVSGPRLLPAAAWVARALTIPLLFHSHHRILQPSAVRLAGVSLRWARATMIACCRFAGQPLARYARRSRIVYNGVPEPGWQPRRRDSQEPWNIGVVGRVEPEKGQMDFVAAARVLCSKFNNCRFTVAGAPLFSGPRYYDRVKQASRDLPFEFVGWQSDVAAVFSKLDLLVVPSSDIDSTPRVVIEAFSGGIPVIAFPNGGIPEIVEDGGTGFLAAEPTAAALAARMESVLRMAPVPLGEVTERARTAWRERYSLESFQNEVAREILKVSAEFQKQESGERGNRSSDQENRRITYAGDRASGD